MKYLFAVLPALATLRVISAQSVVGVHFISAGETGTAEASGTSSVSEAAASSAANESAASTSTDMSAMPTEAPSSSVDNNSYGYTDVMPYSSMTQNGYQQMECGYGYARQSPMGYCEQQAWVSLFFHTEYNGFLICF